jgi:hypothetical protein
MRIVIFLQNYFCQLLNVHGVNNVRQTEIHTAEPLKPELGPFEVEIAVEKSKRYKLPSVDQLFGKTDPGRR